MLDSLVTALLDVGLVLNAEKTVIITAEAQPPSQLTLARGDKITILRRDVPPQVARLYDFSWRLPDAILGCEVPSFSCVPSIFCQWLDSAR